MAEFDYDGMYCHKVKHPIGPLNWVRNNQILRLFNSIPRNKNIKILDLGCGKAYLDIELAKKGCQITAVDLSKEALLFARGLAKEEGVDDRITFVRSDITELNLKGRYDLVICSEVVEHFKDDDSIIRIVYKYLKDGGYAIITTPYNPKLWSIQDEASGHHHRYSMREMLTLLRKNKFLVKKICVYGFPLLRFFKFFHYKTLPKKKEAREGECEFYAFGYVPKGIMLKLYWLFSPILLRLFYFDDLFNFSRKGIGIVVLAKKAY